MPASAPENEMDLADRRAMVGAIYSPCFLRAIVKSPLTAADEASSYAVAISDGHDYTTIAVSVESDRDSSETGRLQAIQEAVEGVAAGIPRPQRLADLAAMAPLTIRL